MEEEVSLLVEAGRKMGARNWVPATSGNLSVRREGTPTRYLISASGGSKSELTTEDFLLFEVGLRRLDARAAKSSAETAVHDLLYGRYAPGAILHGHPLYATMVAQRFVEAGQVTVTGWELIKAMGFWGEGDVLFDLFTTTRAIRRSVIEAGQDTPAPNFGRDSKKPK